MLSSKAFVLIRTDPAKMEKAFQQLQAYTNVLKSLDIVSGPYDMVALVETDNPDQTLRFILEQLRYIEGVVDTLTCFVVRSLPKKTDK